MKHSIICILLLTCSALLAQDPTGPEIIQKVNDLMNQESSKATMEMTITTSSGQKRTFEYLTYSKNKGEKNLMIYESPRRVKGQKILMLNNADDIWAYFVRTKRVRKLATHAKRQKLEGSDFSYEDMGGSNSFITDFNTTLTGNEILNDQECYVIQLDRKPDAGSAYARMIMWVLKENYVPVKIEYYKEIDKLEKTMIQDDIKVIDSVPTGTYMKMTNNSDNTSTEMRIDEIEYNVELDDNFFTERGLKK